MTFPRTLLEADEPPPVLEERRDGRSPFLVVVDHASPRVPRRLGSLGLEAGDLERHIAWDLGALAVARGVAERLDAQLLAQNYSRLVIDCNRDPAVEASIPRRSEATTIPGNADLSADEVRVRREAIFEPYHRRIAEVLDARLASGHPTILVAQHSMTDVYLGLRRSMHAAILYNRDRRFAGLVLDAMRRNAELVVADNEPYFVSDATDYTVPRHAEARGLPYVEIEIRQDLLTLEAGTSRWASLVGDALLEALESFLR